MASLPEDEQPKYAKRTIRDNIRRQAIEKEREECAKANAAYNERLRQLDRLQANPKLKFTDEWFENSFEKELEKRIAAKPAVKITHSQERVPQLLAIAYRKRVEMDNRPYEDDNNVLVAINTAARWLTSTKANSGLILRGGPGIGKTTLMLAIMDVIAILEGKHTQMVTAIEVENATQETMDALAKVEILAIDDMGTELATKISWGNAYSPMVNLITDRHRYLRPTIITTNLVVVDGVDQIRDRYKERMYDRLQQLCNEIKYGGEIKSFRTKK